MSVRSRGKVIQRCFSFKLRFTPDFFALLLASAPFASSSRRSPALEVAALTGSLAGDCRSGLPINTPDRLSLSPVNETASARI